MASPSKEFLMSTSHFILIVFLAYTLIDKTTRVSSAVSSYKIVNKPLSKKYAQHFWYFASICVEIYFWTFLAIYVGMLVLILLKIIVINVAKDDDGKDQEISIMDIHDAFMSYTLSENGLWFMAKLVAGNLLICASFAFIAVTPSMMQKVEDQKLNTRLFLILLLVQLVFMTVLDIVVNTYPLLFHPAK